MRPVLRTLLLAAIILSSCQRGNGEESESRVETTVSTTDQAAELVETGRALLEDDQCEAALEPL